MSHAHESADYTDRRVEELFGVTPRRPLRRWGAAATGVIIAAIVAALIASSAAAGSAGGRFRTATAQIRDVKAQLSSVATIEPVSGAAVAFPTSGTVATLDVAVGDTVSVGQQLGTLDGTAATRTLNQKREALTKAKLTLSRALLGEPVNDGPTGSAATPVSSPSTSSSTSTSTMLATSAGQAVLSVATTGSASTASALAASTSTASDSELSVLQQAVLDAQRKAESAISDSGAAVTSARSVCATVGTATGASTGTADGGEGDSATTSTTLTTSTTTPTTPTGAMDACLAAIEQVQSSQSATAAAQQQVATASSELDSYIAERANSQGANNSGSAVGQGSSTTSSSAADPTSGQSQSQGRSVDGGAPSSGESTAADSSVSTASAAKLVAYQKAVSAAEFQVLVAAQAVAQSTIVAPIAGTVTSIGFDLGDDVTAASSSQNIVIEGGDGVEVVTTVSLTNVASVAVGQPAKVLPDGRSESLDGKVVAVAIVAEDGQSSTSFRVTIALDDPSASIGSGTTGSVKIETADARRVLAVPSSAVSWRNDQPLVSVPDGETSKERNVEIGVIGSDWIEITDGLADGATVVIADLTQALPSSAEASTDQADRQVGGGPPTGGFARPGG